MFEDGIKGAELEEVLQPQDIAEVLAARLAKEPEPSPAAGR
jgi:hypothetical protein